MQHQRLPYGARSEHERQRNLARLGTRWQEQTTPEPPPETLQQAYERGYRDGCRHSAQRSFWWGWFWGSWH
jgi:hypothetical protein